MSALAAKTRSASVTEMTEYVLPQHANVYGAAFGGQIMAWIDLCAAVCAQRHAGHPCVTALVDELFFERPVRVGQVVLLRAHINGTFRSSMEIDVAVRGEDTLSGKRWPTVRCLMIFVAIGEDGRPAPVPPLVHESDEERAVQQAAEERRRVRLARR